ncbi:MAG: DUF192 domain-containing protein [Candidatus Aminicenantales bacterium]|jgi:uncharacterized membrane protein (UPF0127 family)
MTRRCGLFLIAAAALGTPYGGAQGRDRFIKVYFPDGRSVTAELALTETERARGLMNRETILPDQGMLFVFGEEAVHSFWMKNTLIPLDMLWLGSDRRIIHIERDVPPCKADPCPSYGPQRPASYVLELKGGMAAAFQLKVQDRLDFRLPQRREGADRWTE